MSHPLTAGQRALLEAALVQRQHQLDRQIEEQQQGLSRADHAREVLQREGERELGMALADRELQELGAVSTALRRLDSGSYGRCSDCDADIPFDRLKAEPWALRCVACESRHEQAPRRAA